MAPIPVHITPRDATPSSEAAKWKALAIVAFTLLGFTAMVLFVWKIHAIKNHLFGRRPSSSSSAPRNTCSPCSSRSASPAPTLPMHNNSNNSNNHPSTSSRSRSQRRMDREQTHSREGDLADGFQLAGYDADEGTRHYRDRSGNHYSTERGRRYGMGRLSEAQPGVRSGSAPARVVLGPN